MKRLRKILNAMLSWWLYADEDERGVRLQWLDPPSYDPPPPPPMPADRSGSLR